VLVGSLELRSCPPFRPAPTLSVLVVRIWSLVMLHCSGKPRTPPLESQHDSGGGYAVLYISGPSIRVQLLFTF
jgi:hypothetical protein